MIRPFTFLCMVGALGSGLYLYQCKHQAQVLDREIARTIKQTEAARDRIGMLRAEWAQLNQPDRVGDLARAHTTLQTAKPTQFVSAADLAAKLPAPVAMPPPVPLQQADVTPEEAPQPAQAEPPAVTEPTKPSARPTPVTEAPARPAEAQGVAETRRSDPKPDAKPAHQTPSAPVQLATAPALTRSPLPATMRVPAHRPMPAEASPVTASVLRSRPMHDPVPVSTYVQPVAAPAYSAPVYSAPAYSAPAAAAQAQAYPTTAGSVLGGSRGLPPPVPFAAR